MQSTGNFYHLKIESETFVAILPLPHHHQRVTKIHDFLRC